MTFPQYSPDFPGPHDQKRAEALSDPYDAEVRDILWIDVPATVGNLTRAMCASGNAQTAFFGRGITLRVTSHMAQVVIEDPTPEAVSEVERSGHNFRVLA